MLRKDMTGLWGRLASLFGREEEAGESPGNPSNGKSAGIVLFRLKGYEEVAPVADALKRSRPAIVNLEEAGTDLPRINAFLAGVVYALEGEMHRLAPGVFLLTPSGVSLRLAGEEEKETRGSQGHTA